MSAWSSHNLFHFSSLIFDDSYFSSLIAGIVLVCRWSRQLLPMSVQIFIPNLAPFNSSLDESHAPTLIWWLHVSGTLTSFIIMIIIKAGWLRRRWALCALGYVSGITKTPQPFELWLLPWFRPLQTFDIEGRRDGHGDSGTTGRFSLTCSDGLISGTLCYYDIIVFLWYHSLDYDIIVNIISMIS